jgi:hypothetical protein
MSRNKTPHRTGNVVTSTWRRARQAAVRLQPAADHVMPLARNAGAAAQRQADRTRSWAAPQVERAGQVVEDSIAPRVSSLLSAAARRLEPAVPRRPRWRKLVGASAVTAAAGAAAAAVRSHRKAGAVVAPDQAEAGGTGPATEPAPAMETGNGQRSTSSDVGQNSEARTS